MESLHIVQQVIFKAPALDVYNAYLDAEAHAAFTGAPATIRDEVGSNFTAHDGYCFGENLELIPGEKIVQSWAAHEDDWPEGHYSTIEMSFVEEGGLTHMEFIHREVPVALVESIKRGWIDYYWKPMKEYVEKS